MYTTSVCFCNCNRLTFQKYNRARRIGAPCGVKNINVFLLSPCPRAKHSFARTRCVARLCRGVFAAEEARRIFL